MNFWQLISIMRGNLKVVRRVAERSAKWTFIADWVSNHARIVAAQDREKLDFIVSDEFARAVLKKCSVKFFRTKDGRLLSKRRSVFDKRLSALQAFDRYGGAAMEDALEFGSVTVS